MASVLNSKNRLKDVEPDDFDAKTYVGLELQYLVNGGNYLFSYRTAGTAGRDDQDLSDRLREQKWSRFATWEEIKPKIDIDIRQDALVRVDTFGPDLFWSLASDAVMTERDMRRLYGELRYRDGSQWKKREDFSSPSCRQIRFKAKLNEGGPKNERHKFSYNVRLRDKDGVMVEHEIDPDIKNPST